MKIRVGMAATVEWKAGKIKIDDHITDYAEAHTLQPMKGTMQYK